MRAADHLPDRFNVAEWLVRREGRSTAFLGDGYTLSRQELDLAVLRFAGALRAAGIHPGDRVALILPDTPLLVTSFLGALAVGAVAVPINTLLAPKDHALILADADPRLVVADPALYAAPLPDALLWSPAEAEARQAQAAPAPRYAETHRDSFAFMLYSSGTTGEPKGVLHLHHDIWVSAETYGRHVLGIRAEDRCYSVAKLFFAYGLGNSLYFPLSAGAESVLFAGRPAPEAVFEQVRRHRPTLFFGVPTAYANMLAAMETGATADFSSVRACVSAGEALPAPLFERWRARTGLDILDGIGSTEMTHIFLSNRPGRCRPGSTGVAVPGYDLRLVDETGADVPRGELGDLLVRGDSMTALYWNKHEATKRTLRGDWIRTGDKYYQDADGYFFHGGRSDDMIKAGGIWVSPVEVEGAIAAHPAVLECAVVGSADADGLHKPHAFVVLRPGAEASEDQLREHARAKLAHYKAPRWFTFIGELPKTATGKIQRYLLRAP